MTLAYLRLRQRMMTRAARAELERHARVDARITVAERNTEVDHAVLIRLVECADRTRIRIAVMAIAQCELRLVVRVELLHRMQRRQSIAARAARLMSFSTWLYCMFMSW